MKPFRWLAFLLPVVATCPTIASAQTAFSLGVIGGPSTYDLSGTGTTGFGGIRFDVVPEKARFLVLEAGVHYFRYEPQFGTKQTFWFPEASVQLQVPGRIVRPYIGAGAGYGFASDDSMLTLSASLGSRFALTDRWLLRGELRVRSVDPWAGVTADWGLGVSRTF